MFLFDRKQLEQALVRACKVIPKNTTIPALQNLVITSTEEGLLLSCTDMEVSYKSALAALDGAPTEETSICVPAILLQKVVKALPKAFDEVRLDVTSENVLVEATEIRLGADLSDYPTLPSPVDYARTQFPLPQDFLERLKYVLPAVSTETHRYALTGIHFDFPSGNMVASDGTRLHVAELGANARMRPVILPPRALQRITPEQIVVPDDEGAKIVFLEGQEGLVAARPIEGKFPDYRTAIPKKFSTQAVVNREEVLACIEEVLPVLDENSLGCALAFNHALTISAGNGEIQYARELDAARKGKPLTVRFNPYYLKQALKSLRGSEILFSMNEPGSAVRIDTAEDPGWMLLMPLHKDAPKKKAPNSS